MDRAGRGDGVSLDLYLRGMQGSTDLKYAQIDISKQTAKQMGPRRACWCLEGESGLNGHRGPAAVLGRRESNVPHTH